MSSLNYYTRSREVGNSKLIRAGYSLQAFSIANAILWIGNIVYALTTGESLLDFDLLNFDLSIILLYISFAQIVDNPQMLTFAVLGWIVASFWVKKDHPKEFLNIIAYSVIIPFMFLPTIIIIFALNLMLGTFQLEALAIIIFILFAIVVFNLVALMVIVPGVILVYFFNPPVPEKSKMYSMIDFLVLYGPVPPTPNEKIVYCPFRMKSKPGCAYLGYVTPNQPLICDYQSNWQSCYVYTHLFYKLRVLE